MPALDKKRELTRLWMKYNDDVSVEESILGLMRMMNAEQIRELHEMLGEEGEEKGEISTDVWAVGESQEYIKGLLSKSDYPSGTQLFPVLDLSKVHWTHALSKMNHSSNPNCMLRFSNSTLYAYAIKEIKKGDEFVVDYPDLPWIMLFDNRIPKLPKTGGRVPPIPGKDDLDDESAHDAESS